MGLDNQGVVIGNYFQEHLAWFDNTADGEDFQVLYGSRDGSLP